MLRLPIILLFAFLAACGRGGILQSGTLEIPQTTGNWFCQPGAGGDEWDCIQDEELARSPQLAAASTPAATGPAAGEGPEGAPPTATESTAPQEVEPQTATEPPGAIESPGATEAQAAPEPQETTERPAAEPEPQAAAGSHLDADRLMSLPDDHFAVQLVALDSAAELDTFVDTHGLAHLPHARVERDGRIHYVLLLGFYETYALAEAASLDPPAPLEPGDAWIRPLAGLKRAVQRADSLEAG
jgi:septal ring-binding cell division protein DamX